MNELLYSLDGLDSVVELLYNLMNTHQIFTLSGPLGAGKTTLIKRLLARCGVQEVVVSPTFTYVAIYSNDTGDTFYHFDLYRLSSLSSFIESGFDEYLYAPQSWAFIEWPEICEPLLTKGICHISIDYASEHERVLSWTSSKSRV
ncbi:tRNA (adenosine(37)-N6)-threonylcarbamoyltransferase complex ATPase subunit type 1 TsaE [Candidatus Dependentiae bacterium]|nr:tRNA (adenosine(37)-N6)-threonylcarbamoyltransferase complex ATPase subunit type 1 TsaE [Candidatus Dependentiae bacterium]